MLETTKQIERGAFTTWMFWWGALFGAVLSLWFSRWGLVLGAVFSFAWEAWKLWRAYTRDAAAPRPAEPPARA